MLNYEPCDVCGKPATWFAYDRLGNWTSAGRVVARYCYEHSTRDPLFAVGFRQQAEAKAPQEKREDENTEL